MTLILVAIPVGILAAFAVHSWVLKRRTNERIRGLSTVAARKEGLIGAERGLDHVPGSGPPPVTDTATIESLLSSTEPEED